MRQIPLLLSALVVAACNEGSCSGPFCPDVSTVGTGGSTVATIEATTTVPASVPTQKTIAEIGVVVKDDSGAPLQGVAVSWSTSEENASVSAPSTTTDANGIAKTNWTIGTEVGVPNTLTAVASGLPNSPVNFTTTTVIDGSIDYKLVFAGLGVDGYSVAIWNPTDREIVDLHGPVQGPVSQVRLSPDGTKVAFVLSNDGTEGGKDIWEVGSDGTGLSPLLAAVESIEDNPTYSPNGATMLFRRCLGGCWMWTQSASGSETRLEPDGCNPFWYDWHAVGIAYASAFMFDGVNIDCQASKARLQRRLGSGPADVMSLTDGTLSVGPVSWSPDGSQLVYVARGDDGWDDVFTISASGGDNLQRSERVGLAADWTPDGSKILFVRGYSGASGAVGIWEHDLSDGSERLLMSIPGSNLFSFDL